MNSVDPELADCLLLIPDFVDVLEENVSTTDFNLACILSVKAEEFLELLRVLSGKLLTHE